MDNPNIPETARLMQMAVAPVFLISAIGVLIGSMSTRYGRVIDRMRELLRDMANTLPPQVKRSDYHLEVRELYRRARLLRLTIIFSAVAIFLVVLTIVIMFAEMTSGVNLPRLPEVLFSAALITLLVSVSLFIHDFAISLHFFQREIKTRVTPEEYILHHSGRAVAGEGGSTPDQR